MTEDFGFTLHRRGLHALAGRTVLQIVPTLDSGELDHTAIDVAGALAEAGARALVASAGGRLVSELQAKGGVWIPFPARSKNPLAMAVNVRRLRRLLLDERVDLAHARSRPAAWVAYGATRATKTPLVTSVQQIAPGLGLLRQRYNSVMARGDIVIAGSRFAAALVPTLYPWALDRVSLIRPGVELKGFAPNRMDPARVHALRQAWHIAPDERIVLLAARPSLWKGHKILIEATRLLLQAGVRDFKVVLIGDAKGKGQVREIDQAIAKAQVESIVRRVGACADMPAALLAAAVVVVPSLEPEAFGRIAIEAQAVGTPVVVSDLGAVPETVLAPPDVEPARRTGWRVPANDATLLAAAIEETLSLGASSRDALALRARKQVEERFSIERMARQTLDAYAALLDRGDPSA
ncbi:glycosyltransferase [Beijerinckia sp. L45]|uniref:glycosyltransferase n=1 Tax=Beijerinckia sp. L45 TaxID=1641855 RepID=UPI00131C9CF5|nr:glycosyltransferase [Beijerinckia sp. L45]